MVHFLKIGFCYFYLFIYFGCEYLSSLSVECINPCLMNSSQILTSFCLFSFLVAYLLSWGKDPLMATFAFAAFTFERLNKTSLSDSVSQRSPLFSSSSFTVLRLPVNSLINLDLIFVFNESRGFLFLSLILPFSLPSFPLLFLAFRLPVFPASLTEEMFLSLMCAFSAFVESWLPEETRVYF